MNEIQRHDMQNLLASIEHELGLRPPAAVGDGSRLLKMLQRMAEILLDREED